jgi:uncharacterized Fe-S cluster protein YjdI
MAPWTLTGQGYVGADAPASGDALPAILSGIICVLRGQKHTRIFNTEWRAPKVTSTGGHPPRITLAIPTTTPQKTHPSTCENITIASPNAEIRHQNSCVTGASHRKVRTRPSEMPENHKTAMNQVAEDWPNNSGTCPQQSSLRQGRFRTSSQSAFRIAGCWIQTARQVAAVIFCSHVPRDCHSRKVVTLSTEIGPGERKMAGRECGLKPIAQ